MSDEPAGYYTSKERKLIAQVRRRMAYLEKRTADNPTLTYDRVELAALRWMIYEVEAGRGKWPKPGESNGKQDQGDVGVQDVRSSSPTSSS